MKLVRRICLLFVVFSPIAAFAYPAIGDYVEFKDNKGGWSTQLISKRIASPDLDRSWWYISSSIFLGDGHHSGYYSERENKDMVHREQVLEILAKCKKNGNVKETVTVKAGRFEACRVYGYDMYHWYADVPFGIVKWHNTYSNRTSELIKYVDAENN
jgi:hypothetical protein